MSTYNWRTAYLRFFSMRIGLALFIFLALAAVACSSSTSSSSTDLCAKSGAAVTVNATDDLHFAPAAITVIVGQSVCWQNTGKMTHTVAEGVADRFGAILPPGQTYVYTFTFGENYGYYCAYHSNMTGTIMVTCKPGQITC